MDFTLDPKIHSHIEDCLPEEHPLAYQHLFCKDCNTLIHAGNNECMSTWVETGIGNFCLQCFYNHLVDHDCMEALDDELGLQ